MPGGRLRAERPGLGLLGPGRDPEQLLLDDVGDLADPALEHGALLEQRRLDRPVAVAGGEVRARPAPGGRRRRGRRAGGRGCPGGRGRSASPRSLAGGGGPGLREAAGRAAGVAARPGRGGDLHEHLAVAGADLPPGHGPAVLVASRPIARRAARVLEQPDHRGGERRGSPWAPGPRGRPRAPRGHGRRPWPRRAARRPARTTAVPDELLRVRVRRNDDVGRLSQRVSSTRPTKRSMNWTWALTPSRSAWATSAAR